MDGWDGCGWGWVGGWMNGWMDERATRLDGWLNVCVEVLAPQTLTFPAPRNNDTLSNYLYCTYTTILKLINSLLYLTYILKM